MNMVRSNALGRVGGVLGVSTRGERIRPATRSSVLLLSLLLLLTAIFALLLPATAGAPPSPVIFVDDDAPGLAPDGLSWETAFKSLQDALTTAVAGDRIWVAAGVYKPTVKVLGPDPENRAFQLKNGVTLYGGFAGTEVPATFDLGTRDFAANETILSGDMNGDDDPNDITVNRTDNVYHVFLHHQTGVDSTAVLDGVTVSGGGKVDTGGGGGMYNYYDSPTLVNVIFSSNAGWRGGGLHNYIASPTLTNVAFSGNAAGYDGGGMYSGASSNPTLKNVTFSGNAAEYGGGMSNDSFSSANLTNVVFSANTASADGGGMYNYGYYSNLLLTNVTFSGNAAADRGGGAYTRYTYEESLTLTNCILYGNTAGISGAQISNVVSLGPVTASISYSDVQGSGGSGAGWDAALGTDGGGNIDADPNFDADGFHLLWPSPAIDAGSSAAVPSGVTTDIDDDPRIVGAAVDMGADESMDDGPSVFFVDWDAVGANTGASWTDAFTDLQSALSAAVSGDEIWVAAGTYRPDGASPGDRYLSFALKSGVAVYGGFAGTETARDQRDWTSNLTSLSGEIGAAGAADNSGHVVRAASVTGAVLDGFTVTAGNADWSGGGGIYAYESSFTLSNVVFSLNSGIEGGGMNNNTSSPTLVDVTFSDNEATGSGGGMYNESSTLTLTDVTFTGNSAVSNGGGMCNESSSLSLQRIEFRSNEAYAGGGVSNGAGELGLSNALFTANSATYGGGMYNYGDPIAELRYVSFGANTGAFGSGICNSGSSPNIANCIFWDDGPGQEIYNDPTSYPIVSYSIVRGFSGGDGNLDADPLFVDAASGNLHLQVGSPAIDAGGEVDWMPIFDLDGVARPQDGDGSGTAEVDMGAYEYPKPITLRAGWNLVAGAAGTDFGGDLFGWSGNTYTSTTDPVAWLGYWRKVDVETTVILVTAPGPHTTALAEGWNLIGNPMSTTATLTLPPTRQAFIYDPEDGYSSTSTLAPGQGAWVRGAVDETVVFTPVGP